MFLKIRFSNPLWNLLTGLSFKKVSLTRPADFCHRIVILQLIIFHEQEDFKMHFALSKELEMLRKAVREFAAKKIAPNADEWDKNHYSPYKEALKPMGELGFFGTVIPEEYGGDNMGWLERPVGFRG